MPRSSLRETLRNIVRLATLPGRPTDRLRQIAQLARTALKSRRLGAVGRPQKIDRRLALELHEQGQSFAAIARELKAKHKIKVTSDAVRKAIVNEKNRQKKNSRRLFD